MRYSPEIFKSSLILFCPMRLWTSSKRAAVFLSYDDARFLLVHFPIREGSHYKAGRMQQNTRHQYQRPLRHFSGKHDPVETEKHFSAKAPAI